MEDKTLKCEDCGEDFDFSAKDQEFYVERGIRSPRDANPAGIRERPIGRGEIRGRCTMRHAQSVESPPRYHSDHLKTGPFTAETVTSREDRGKIFF